MRPAAGVVFKLLRGALLLATASAASAQVGLAPDSEVGFRRFMGMAAEGRFGAQVDNANVAIGRHETRIELTRDGTAVKVFRLEPKEGSHTYSRYFDITAVGGANASDVAALGAALDDAFGSSPYRIAGVEPVAGWRPPPWRRVWRDGSWRGVAQAFEFRLMMPASRARALVATGLLAVLMAVSCGLLWWEGPGE